MNYIRAYLNMHFSYFHILLRECIKLFFLISFFFDFVWVDTGHGTGTLQKSGKFWRKGYDGLDIFFHCTYCFLPL